MSPGFLGWIRNAQAGSPGEWDEQVWITTRFAHNVFGRNSSRGQGIGDERAMAAPGYRFRAHYRGPLFPSQFDEMIESRVELVRLHVVGVTRNEAFFHPMLIESGLGFLNPPSAFMWMYSIPAARREFFRASPPYCGL